MAVPGDPTIYISTQTESTLTVAIAEGGGQDTYSVYIGPDAESLVLVADDVDGAETYYEFEGLDAETPYTVRVEAVNGDGSNLTVVTADGETEAAIVSAAGLTPPRDVTLALGSPSYSAVVVTWRLCEDAACLVEARVLGSASGFIALAQTTPLLRTATVTNLSPSTTYEFRVVNAAGPSAEPYPQITTGSNSPPTAPSNLVVSATFTNGATFTWDDNSADERGFVVWIRNPITRQDFYSSVAANIETLSYRNLQDGTSYVARITALGQTGIGNSAWVPALTLPGVQFTTRNLGAGAGGEEPPQPPSAFAGYSTGETSMRLSFRDNSVNENGFRIRINAADGSLFRFVELPVNNTEDVIEVDLSGFYSGQTYTCTLAAWNNGGDSVAYEIDSDGNLVAIGSSFPPTVTVTTDRSVRAPATPPTDLEVNEIGVGTGIVTLDATATNADVIHIYRDTIPPTAEVELTAVLSPLATSFIDDTATAGADYTYWATAEQTGEDETDPSNTDTIVYSAPLDVPGTAAYEHSLLTIDTVTLMAVWSVSTVDYLTARVEISATASTGPWSVAEEDIQPGTLSVMVADIGGVALTPSTQYWTRVILVNSFGDSDPSNVATATTSGDAPAAPAGPTITSITVLGSSVARIIFTANDDSATTYQARLSTGGAYANAGSPISAFGSLIIDLVGLTGSTNHNAVVRATNETGTGDSEPYPFRTGSSGGTPGEFSRHGSEVVYVRNVDKDDIDIDIATPTSRSVVTFASQTPDETLGPFVTLWVDGALTTPINPLSGEAQVRDRVVTAGDTLTVKITGTGTGTALYRLSVQAL